jgi:hypothetical protein
VAQVEEEPEPAATPATAAPAAAAPEEEDQEDGQGVVLGLCCCCSAQIALDDMELLVARGDRTVMGADRLACTDCAELTLCLRGHARCRCSVETGSAHCPLPEHAFQPAATADSLGTAEQLSRTARGDVTIDPFDRCDACRASRQHEQASYRARRQTYGNSIDNELARNLSRLNMQPASPAPLPKQSETCFSEAAAWQWEKVFAFAKRARHKSDRHGPRGSYRKLNKNANILSRLAPLAAQWALKGREHTLETGSEQLLRLYTFVTSVQRANTIDAARTRASSDAERLDAWRSLGTRDR